MTQLKGAVTRYAYPIQFVKTSAANGTHTLFPLNQPRVLPYEARVVALSYENVGGQAANGTLTTTLNRNGTATAATHTVNGTLPVNSTGKRVWQESVAVIPAGDTLSLTLTLANQTSGATDFYVLAWVMVDDVQE